MIRSLLALVIVLALGIAGAVTLIHQGRERLGERREVLVQAGQVGALKWGKEVKGLVTLHLFVTGDNFAGSGA